MFFKSTSLLQVQLQVVELSPLSVGRVIPTQSCGYCGHRSHLPQGCYFYNLSDHPLEPKTLRGGSTARGRRTDPEKNKNGHVRLRALSPQRQSFPDGEAGRSFRFFCSRDAGVWGGVQLTHVPISESGAEAESVLRPSTVRSEGMRALDLPGDSVVLPLVPESP